MQSMRNASSLLLHRAGGQRLDPAGSKWGLYRCRKALPMQAKIFPFLLGGLQVRS